MPLPKPDTTPPVTKMYFIPPSPTLKKICSDSTPPRLRCQRCKTEIFAAFCGIVWSIREKSLQKRKFLLHCRPYGGMVGMVSPVGRFLTGKNAPPKGCLRGSVVFPLRFFSAPQGRQHGYDLLLAGHDARQEHRVVLRLHAEGVAHGVVTADVKQL